MAPGQKSILFMYRRTSHMIPSTTTELNPLTLSDKMQETSTWPVPTLPKTSTWGVPTSQIETSSSRSVKEISTTEYYMTLLTTTQKDKMEPSQKDETDPSQVLSTSNAAVYQDTTEGKVTGSLTGKVARAKHDMTMGMNDSKGAGKSEGKRDSTSKKEQLPAQRYVYLMFVSKLFQHT